MHSFVIATAPAAMKAFDFANPYPSARLPVFARNVVSTSHPLAAQAGLAVLQQGGNAVDAAVAAAACMTVVEPVSNGLGSDLFALVWDGRRLHGLNASGRAPAAWTPAYLRARPGATDAAGPKRGVDSITVPGAVAGWQALLAKFGQRSMGDVLARAIDIAQRGYLVPVVVQQKWAAAVAELGALPGFADTFLPRGRAPDVGEHFAMPHAARALQAIARDGAAAYYQGEIAQAAVGFLRQHGGAHTLADFAAYQPEWVEPIAQSYRGYTVHEIPPNGQGIAALMALGMAQHFDVASMAMDSAATQHLLIEAMKLAFADTYAMVADPVGMRVSAAQMLDPAYLAERARLIDPQRAQVFGPGNPVKGGTIYLTAADERGIMVSLIQSNYMGFGAGVVEPTYGISFQNRGHGFSLAADSPNCVAPGKRPFHTIIPAFLTKGDEAVMSFGVMGGNMQPQGHLQTLVRMLDFHQSPQAACDAPRWRFNHGLNLNVEDAMPAATVQGLRDLGHQVESFNDSYQDFGAGQFIWRAGRPDVEGYIAASDTRRDGLAAGF
jgi:gamma-glutamyltranspeptidase / glutathione hydrolase